MTRDQFNDAALSLGIRFTPDITDEREVQWKAVDDPQQQDRASVTREEGMLLAELANGRRVIEIGTGVGISTVCLAHKAICVHTVDPNEWVLNNLKFPDHVVQHDSFECIGEDFPDERFDFAFIDGLHSPSQHVEQDIRNCLSVMVPGGVIAFHDAHWTCVQTAINEFRWASKIVHDTVGTLTICGIPYAPVAA